MIVSHQSSIMSLILVALIGSCLTSSAIAMGGEIRLGTAVVKITPPLGTPLAGYYMSAAAKAFWTTSAQGPWFWTTGRPKRRW